VAGNSTQAGRTVVNKVSTILLLFNQGTEYSLTEIAQLADVPLSSAHRYINELVAARFLERTGGARYRTGELLRYLGPAQARPPSLDERGPYVVDDLSNATNCRVRLGVLDHHNVAYIEKVPGRQPPTAFRPAATVPAHATAMGRCLLAFDPMTTVDRLILGGLRVYTAQTVCDAGELRAALASVRRTHLAVTRGELEAGVCSVAMPVFGTGHRAIAAIEVSVRDPDRSLHALLVPLAVACRSLSRELGCGPTVSSHDGPTPVVRHEKDRQLPPFGRWQPHSMEAT